jgi:hypothetical protein
VAAVSVKAIVIDGDGNEAAAVRGDPVADCNRRVADAGVRVARPRASAALNVVPTAATGTSSTGMHTSVATVATLGTGYRGRSECHGGERDERYQTLGD